MAELLLADYLQAAVFDQCSVDLDLVVLPVVDSTNDWCMQQCRSGRSLPFSCFAEKQTQGKGRRGKQWQMSATNIAMSLTWPIAAHDKVLQLLPLSVAMVIAGLCSTR